MSELPPVFALETKPDATRLGVTLQIMPRAYFSGLGFQTGIRLVTTKDGESIYEQTVGMSDDEVADVVTALLAQQQRS